jgi:hypothetical protein
MIPSEENKYATPVGKSHKGYRSCDRIVVNAGRSPPCRIVATFNLTAPPAVTLGLMSGTVTVVTAQLGTVPVVCHHSRRHHYRDGAGNSRRDRDNDVGDRRHHGHGDDNRRRHARLVTRLPAYPPRAMR